MSKLNVSELVIDRTRNTGDKRLFEYNINTKYLSKLCYVLGIDRI